MYQRISNSPQLLAQSWCTMVSDAEWGRKQNAVPFHFQAKKINAQCQFPGIRRRAGNMPCRWCICMSGVCAAICCARPPKNVHSENRRERHFSKELVRVVPLVEPRHLPPERLIIVLPVACLSSALDDLFLGPHVDGSIALYIILLVCSSWSLCSPQMCRKTLRKRKWMS